MSKYEYKTKPYQHQVDALRRSWREPAWAYLMEMGTGKSKVVIDNVAGLYEHGEVDALLVVAPKTVCRNWSTLEIPTHLPDRIPRHVTLWVPASEQRGAWEVSWDRLLSFQGLAVFVVNVDALVTKAGADAVEKFLRRRRVYWAVDESNTIKNPRAKRTKVALKLAPLAKYRRILTGTPVTKDPLDLWGQAEFLRHGILGDTSFWSFRARYAVLREQRIGGRAFMSVEGFRNLDGLNRILAGFSTRVLKSECLTLPEKLYTIRHVAMTPEQKSVYTAMRKDFIADVASGSITAQNVLTRILRLQQILCGAVPTDDGKVQEIPSGRLEALLDVIDETGDAKSIVWAPFRRDVARIATALEAAHGRGTTRQLHGDVSPEERADAVHAFQTDKKVRFIVGTQQTGGVGITLTAATCVVYFANTWDLGIREQSEARAHRIGQRFAVTYVDLVTPDTVDSAILDALKSKRTLAEAVTTKEIAKWI